MIRVCRYLCALALTMCLACDEELPNAGSAAETPDAATVTGRDGGPSGKGTGGRVLFQLTGVQ